MKTNTMKRLPVLILCAMLSSGMAQAQDWQSVLKGLTSAVGSKVSDKLEKAESFNLEGTWQYVKPDVKLESDDILSKAGGELVVKKGEEELLDILDKIGINDRTTVTFNADSTYLVRTEKRTMQGTYSLNKETHEIILTSKLKLKFTAKVDQSILKPKDISIRFKADKLMGLVKHLTGTLAQNSTNKNIALANSLLSKYDGLTLGAELKKQ